MDVLPAQRWDAFNYSRWDRFGDEESADDEASLPTQPGPPAAPEAAARRSPAVAARAPPRRAPAAPPVPAARGAPEDESEADEAEKTDDADDAEHASPEPASPATPTGGDVPFFQRARRRRRSRSTGPGVHGLQRYSTPPRGARPRGSIERYTAPRVGFVAAPGLDYSKWADSQWNSESDEERERLPPRRHSMPTNKAKARAEVARLAARSSHPDAAAAFRAPSPIDYSRWDKIDDEDDEDEDGRATAPAEEAEGDARDDSPPAVAAAEEERRRGGGVVAATVVAATAVAAVAAAARRRARGIDYSRWDKIADDDDDEPGALAEPEIDDASGGDSTPSVVVVEEEPSSPRPPSPRPSSPPRRSRKKFSWRKNPASKARRGPGPPRAPGAGSAAPSRRACATASTGGGSSRDSAPSRRWPTSPAIAYHPRVRIGGDAQDVFRGVFSPRLAAPPKKGSAASLLRGAARWASGSLGGSWAAPDLEGMDASASVPCAVKKVRLSELGAGLNELKCLLKLKRHANVVRVYGQAEDGDEYLYLALELCHGTLDGLANMVRRRSRGVARAPRGDLEKLDLVDVCKQMAGGLTHLHENGIIHRDIKPSNILWVARSGAPVIKLADFGISKALDARNGRDEYTVTSSHAGTVGYMAREFVKLKWDSGVRKSAKMTEAQYKARRRLRARLLHGAPPSLDAIPKMAGPHREVLARALIEAMLDHDARNRPAARTVQNHAFFFQLPGD
ncbi:ribonuclease [Aureococcus anophagefferens]|nr:ribonuclease [Aureococcus anophagefferens]